MNPSRLPRDLDDMLAQRHYSRPVWKYELGAVIMGLFMAALVIIWSAYLLGCTAPAAPELDAAPIAAPPMAATAPPAPAGAQVDGPVIGAREILFPGHRIRRFPDGGLP